jgi:hypothetical protein
MGSTECTFESLVMVDPAASESALVDRIAQLERVKSAAAAGQARAAAALDAARRAAEAVAGVPALRRGRGVASEVALARRIRRPGVTGISDLPRLWCTRCRIRWLLSRQGC